MEIKHKRLLIIILVCVLVGASLFIFSYFKNKSITGNVIAERTPVHNETEIEIISGDKTDFCIKMQNGRLACKMGSVKVSSGKVQEQNVNISMKSKT